MSIRWFPLFGLLLLNVSGCVTADILIGLGAIGGLSETLNISPFYVILGFFCLIILGSILKDSTLHGKNNHSPELKIGIGVILAIIAILCFISGRAPAKPTKLQPKQGTVATEKERLIYTDPKTGLMWPIDANIAGKKMNWVDAVTDNLIEPFSWPFEIVSSSAISFSS